MRLNASPNAAHVAVYTRTVWKSIIAKSNLAEILHGGEKTLKKSTTPGLDRNNLSL